MSIHVIVVDDQVDSFLEKLNSLDDFKFIPVKTFDSSKLLDCLDAHKEVTVVLLDIIKTEPKPKDSMAGLNLFRSLDAISRWKERKGTVQIVFFSIDPTAKSEYQATIDESRAGDDSERYSIRLDLAGYLSKDDLLKGEENTINILRMADEKAKRFKKYPVLADPSMRKCELLFSPNNHAMQRIRETIYLAGRCFEPVLIQGETGTGKELVAASIYHIMKGESVKDPPNYLKGCGDFHPYNIGGAPTEGNLQYTELFGAMSESYSGCTKDRMGIFERASYTLNVKNNEWEMVHGGTVFLDEIGDAHPIIQVALLRVLQTDEIIPLGGFSSFEEVKKEVRFRLISASNVDLPQKIRIKDKNKSFREDLFYRLSTIQITIPPLRERKEDIPVLVYHFLDKVNKDYYPDELSKHKRIKDEKGLFKELKAYDWPGNVRQLEHAIRASFVMCMDEDFVLSDEVREMLAETDEISTKHKSSKSFEEILERLKQSPMKLPKLQKKYGEKRVLLLMQYYIDKFGRLPNEDDSKKLFATERPNTISKWLADKGFSAREIKKRQS